MITGMKVKIKNTGDIKVPRNGGETTRSRKTKRTLKLVPGNCKEDSFCATSTTILAVKVELSLPHALLRTQIIFCAFFSGFFFFLNNVFRT